MSTDDTAHTRLNGEPFSERDARALTETMLVLAESPRVARSTDGRYHVISGESDYVVDLVAKTCGCPDALHRGTECKHQRRAAFATGRRPIPAWAETDALDDGLGEHVSGQPRRERADGTTEVVPDA